MKKLLNKKMRVLKNQKGLTLIELLVVIVILGIIAAIAIPAISSQSQKAKNSADAQTIQIVEDAAQRYFVETGNAPDSIADDLVGDYLAEAPVCSNGNSPSLTATKTDSGTLTATATCTE